MINCKRIGVLINIIILYYHWAAYHGERISTFSQFLPPDLLCLTALQQVRHLAAHIICFGFHLSLICCAATNANTLVASTFQVVAVRYLTTIIVISNDATDITCTVHLAAIRAVRYLTTIVTSNDATDITCTVHRAAIRAVQYLTTIVFSNDATDKITCPAPDHRAAIRAVQYQTSVTSNDAADSYISVNIAFRHGEVFYCTVEHQAEKALILIT